MSKVVDNEGNILEYLGEDSKRHWHIYRNIRTADLVLLINGPEFYKDYSIIEAYRQNKISVLRPLAKKQLLRDGYPEELLK